MTDKVYNRSCDKLLKYLDARKMGDAVLFTTGKFRKERPVTHDVFEALNIPPENIGFLTSTLESAKMIEVFSKGGGVSGYDHETNTHISSGTYQIKITEIGSKFIQSTSFSREARKDFLHKWLPNITTVATVAISLVSLAVSILSYRNPSEKQTEQILKQINLDYNQMELRINARIDSLWSHHTAIEKNQARQNDR